MEIGGAMKTHANRWSWIGIFALILSIAAGIPSLAQPVSAQPADSEATEEFAGTISDRACPSIGPAGEREGDTYFCGLLTVPENYDEPDGRQIQITFGVLKSFSNAPLPDPMIYLDGGPGGSSMGNIYGRSRMFADVRQHRDVIIFDQRGTKYSTRLNCDPYRYAYNYLLETDEEFQEIYQEIQELSEADTLPTTILQIIYEACASGLIEAGFDITQYNSANSAKDIFALTNALGYDEINIVGISYGTRLALTAMRDHPQQIRSVVIDSVYPLEVNGIEDFPRQYDEQINRIVETCENDRECNRAFPNFRANLAALAKGFAEAGNLNGLYGLFSLFTAANTIPAIAEYLPLIVEEVATGAGNTPTLDAVNAGDLPLEEEPEDQPGQADDILLEAEDLMQTAESLFLSAALSEQANRPGAVFMKHVGEVMAPLSREENGEAAIGLLSIPLYNPVPEADWLRGFVVAFLPEESHEDLLAEIDGLDEFEIQYVWDLINELSDDLSGDPGTTDGMYYAVECQEEAPFNDIQVAYDSIEDLNFPELGGLVISISEEIAAVCEVWPNAEPAPNEDEPVVSDIPTLILVGDWDTQTPASWGAPMLDDLSNAQLVEAPASGHGVMLDSDCAYDIFLAFMYSPNSPVNQSCLRNLEPDFVTASEAEDLLADIYGEEDDATDQDEGDDSTDSGDDQDEDDQTDEDEQTGDGEDDDSGGGEDRPVSGR
jgi:pimeloyl-ACP methyl ester carboxylesterase